MKKQYDSPHSMLDSAQVDSNLIGAAFACVVASVLVRVVP